MIPATKTILFYDGGILFSIIAEQVQVYGAIHQIKKTEDDYDEYSL